jgi:hypothetical protein
MIASEFIRKKIRPKSIFQNASGRSLLGNVVHAKLLVGLVGTVLGSLIGCWHGSAQTDDPFAPKPAVPPGFRLVAGDILVPLFVPKSPFPTDTSRYWPNGNVPYEFDANVTAANQQAMTNAMAQWEAVANVHFVPRNSENDYAHIQNSTGNNSEIGRSRGQQVINIFNWDFTFIMVHELGHCLGFDHTQTRPDRANYVTINYGNIQSGSSGNFDVAVGFNYYGPYDFDSVMEYDQCAFSIDCPTGATCGCSNLTIAVLPPYDVLWQSQIGQRDHLRTFDKLIMSFLYPQSNWRFVDLNFTGSPESGTFFKPYKTFAAGKSGVSSGGTLWIQPGVYAGIGTHNKAMTIKAPLGGVTLQ